MRSSAGAHAETARLARVLGLEGPEALAFLSEVPAAELRRYREDMIDLLFEGDQAAFQRLARAARLVPPRTAALIGERALGPLLCARVTGLVEPTRAAQIACHFSVDFLARVAAELDPRRAVEVITAMAPDTVGAVAAAMAQAGEHVAMGRFVAYLDRAAIAACAARLDDADLLRVSLVLEGEERLDVVAEVLGAHRTSALLAEAGALGLAEEASELLGHLSARNRALIERRPQALADQPDTGAAEAAAGGPAAATPAA